MRLPQNRKEDLFAEVSSLVHHMFLLTESRLRNGALIFLEEEEEKKRVGKMISRTRLLKYVLGKLVACGGLCCLVTAC